MSSRYEVSERDGKTVDVLTDDTSGTRLAVARLGAEPISLARRGADGQWTGFLWRDDDFSKNPDGWSNHATVMGYYLHRILNGRTTYRGHEVVGGTHSFLRHKTFPEPEVDIADGRAALTYTMLPSGYEPQEYPFRVSLALTYSLEADGALRVRFRFESQEPDLTTHVSFGLHPGFAVGSMAEAQVLLPPGIYKRHLAPGDYLSGETVTIDHPGGPMPFDKKELPGSFLVEPVDVAGEGFHAGRSRRRSARGTRLPASAVPDALERRAPVHLRRTLLGVARRASTGAVRGQGGDSGHRARRRAGTGVRHPRRRLCECQQA